MQFIIKGFMTLTTRYFYSDKLFQVCCVWGEEYDSFGNVQASLLALSRYSLLLLKCFTTYNSEKTAVHAIYL